MDATLARRGGPVYYERMGIFAVDVRVARPGRRPRWRTFRRVMVDTGAEMTRLPDPGLRAAGIEVFKRDQLFVMANGQYVTRHVGTAIIEFGEFKTVDEVVFGQPGDLSLLGARTLEGFNVLVDARRRKLVAAGPLPAAPGARPAGTRRA
jgi:predicted aspartyl protease